MQEVVLEKQICEVVGIFKNMLNLEAAVDDLYTVGFDQAEVSMLADEKAVKKQLGEEYKRVDDIADDPNVPRTPYVANENIGAAQGGLIGGLLYVGTLATANLIIAAGGTLASALTTAALAGGASTIVGLLLGKYVGEHHANYLEEQIKHGGLLLWVHVRDEQKAQLAKEILSKNGARDVHTHYVPANVYANV